MLILDNRKNKKKNKMGKGSLVSFYNKAGLPQGKVSKILKDEEINLLYWSPHLRQSKVQELSDINAEDYTRPQKKVFSTLYLLYGTLCQINTTHFVTEDILIAGVLAKNFDHEIHQDPALELRGMAISDTFSRLNGLVTKNRFISLLDV